MPIEQHMYTSCPPGKGYDRIDGFQTKARSPGLTDAMSSIIRNYCGRYLLPRSAQDIEYTCRREGRQVPSQALVHFPIALTYYPIAGDGFALTRICYRGQDHSGRFGAFFAHTLVFPVQALQPFDYNPLALTRTHLFQSADPSDRTILPALPDFENLQVTPDRSGMRIAAQEPYAERLVHLLSATMGVQQTGRPVILCLRRWDHAAALIEALLLLLPPEVRCRTTFTTYEHDPYRLQGLGSAQSQSAQLPLQIVVTLSHHEGGAFKFQHDEYHAQFAIFNFAERRFSPPSSLSAYAQYVTDCYVHSHLDRVASVQTLMTDMEVGREPAQWDMLLPAISLEEPCAPQPRPEAVRQATLALLAVAQRPTQVATTIKLLWPTVQHCSRRDPGTLFEQAIQAYRELLERLPTDAPSRAQAQQALLTMASQLLKEGRARRAMAALIAMAPYEDEALAAMLWHLVQAGWPGSANATELACHEEDRAVMPELLTGALQAMQAQFVEPQVLATMVAAAYQSAGKMSCLPALWAHTGMGIVMSLLRHLGRVEALDFVSRLLTLLTCEMCPDGMLALRLWRWHADKPPSLEHWQREAAELARVATRCLEPQKATGDVVELVRQLCEETDYPVVVAAMGEAVGKDASVYQVLCDAYIQALRPVFKACAGHTALLIGRRARLWSRLLGSH